LGYAGLLHDAEKVTIPLGVLSKKSPFDTGETEIVREHPRLIFEKLQDFESDIIKQIVVAHHEYKQNPYPRKGNDRRTTNRATPDRRQHKVRVHSLAQIVAIADMYDALASPRSYKAALSRGATEKVLRQQFTGAPKYIDQALQRYKLEVNSR
jgi:two-component system response regulator RpfG